VSTSTHGLSPRGRLTQTVAANSTIRKLLPEQTETLLVAGASEQEGFLDGVGPAARFDEPSGIVAIGDGFTLVIADFNNDSLRSLDVRTNAVSTIMGGPSWNGFGGGGGWGEHAGFEDDGIGGSAVLSGPLCLSAAPPSALWGDEAIFVTESRVRRIRRVARTADGVWTAMTVRSGGTSNPGGLTVSPRGDVLIAEYRGGVVTRLRAPELARARQRLALAAGIYNARLAEVSAATVGLGCDCCRL